jgi:FkbM family methyltransferase
MNLHRLRTAFGHASRLPEVVSCVRAMHDGARVAASYVGLTPLPLPCEVTFRSGVTYRLQEYYDLETLWQIHFHHAYPLRPSDRLIVDAGANIGLFTCWAASRNPHSRVVAIEPSPGSFERLRQHVRLNGFEDRVLLFPLALSSTNTSVWVSQDATASQMHHVTAEKMPDTAMVDAVSLSDVMATLPDQPIDFLKMDIERSEYDVLLSTPPARLARIRRINVEYHRPHSTGGPTKHDLIQHLSACGFRSVVDRNPASMYGMIHASRD